MTKRIVRESGFSMIEVIVSIALSGVLGLAVTMGVTTSLRSAKRTEIHYAASSLAASRLEQLAAVDTLDLGTSYNETSTSITWPGIDLPFLRTTAVTIGADGSRTLTVTVRCNLLSSPVVVTFETTHAQWE